VVTLDRRKMVYTLLTAAFLLNSGLALYDNDLTGAPKRFIKDLINPGDGSDPFDVGLIKAGSTYTSSFRANVTLARGSDAGYYTIEADSSNSLYGDAYRQRMIGDYQLSYVTQSAPAISLSGSIERTRLISLTDTVSANLDTTVTVVGPSGGSIPASRSSVELLDHAGTWSDMAWMRLLSIMGGIRGNGSGEATLDMSLDEVGISLSKAPIHWTAHIEGDVMVVDLESTSQDLRVKAIFRDGVPWPISYDLECHGTYLSEDGPVLFSMGISCEMKGAGIIGSGSPIPWDDIIREPSVAPSAAPAPVGTTISEGGETMLRFSPQQALDKAKEQSSALRSFLNEPGVTFSDMSYYTNASRVPEEVVWNITLTASRATESGHPSYTFSVAVPLAGGRLDLNRFSLIYERAIYRTFPAEAGRPLITLDDNEDSLIECRLSDKFISGGSYDSSYQLHIIDRAVYGTSASTTLFSNMMGLGGSRGSDLFISYAEDPRDHKTVYLAVIDGVTGNVASLVTLTGSLSPYGANLA
jgi:hypothetical protein